MQDILQVNSLESLTSQWQAQEETTTMDLNRIPIWPNKLYKDN